MRTIVGVIFVYSSVSCAGEFLKSSSGYNDGKEVEDNNHGTSDIDFETGSLYELKSFEIDFDHTPLSETEIIPTDENDPAYEDYVENYSVQNTVEIVWDNTSARISGSTENITVTCEEGDVTICSKNKGMRYILKGHGTDGMVSIYSDYKFRLDIDGLTLSNADGPAVNIQTGKRAYVVLSGSSTLSDGAIYSASADEDRKGTLFSEGQLCFSGSGSLNVTGTYKNAIVSDDYLFFRSGPVINISSSGTNGIKANDWIHIKGGVLNVEASASGGKCLSSDGYIRIDGGRTTLLTTGGVDETDYSSSCCVKSDSIFVISEGELYCKSIGRGGKGIKADRNAYFNGGKVRVMTTGADYGTSGGGMWGGNTSSDQTARPKGIRVEGKLFINGGDIMVQVSSHEGIESKSYIEMNGGRVLVYSYDDAVNSAGELIFNGGSIFSYSTSNDGLDSNGNMYFNDGVIFSTCASNGVECAIDVNEEGRATMTVNGGLILAMGGSSSIPSSGNQCYCVFGSSGMGGGPGGFPGGGIPGGGFGGGFGGGRPSSGSSSVNISSGTAYSVDGILTFISPVSASGIFISSPTLEQGVSYTLSSGVNIIGGNDFCGLITGAQTSGGSVVRTMSPSKP